MISQWRLMADAFTRKLRDRGLPERIIVRWAEWNLEKGNPKGVTAASPQFPAPFGPPIRMALTLDDEVVIQPANEQNRRHFLGELSRIPAWEGLIQRHHTQRGEWLKVPDGRVTNGRFMVFEVIQGKRFPVYGLFATDGWHVELNDMVANVVKSSFDSIDDFMAAEQARMKKSTIIFEGGEKEVTRTPAQQEWRNNTEDQIADLARADYHFKNSQYQSTPTKHPDDEGVRHPAGFIIRDRRAYKDAP